MYFGVSFWLGKKCVFYTYTLIIIFQLGIYVFHYKQWNKIMAIYCHGQKNQGLIKAFVLLFPIIFANLESFRLRLKQSRKERNLNQ